MDHELEREIRELAAKAKPLGAEAVSRYDSQYSQTWYKVIIGDEEYSCGTNEYSLRSFLKGFIAGKEG